MTKQIEVAKPHLRKSIVVEYKGKSNAAHKIKIKTLQYIYTNKGKVERVRKRKNGGMSHWTM